MTLIQIVLTFALISYGAYAQFQRRVSRIVSNLSTLACGFGFILVWNPGLSSDLAHVLGVGRGADLLFYVFIAVSGFIGLYLHLRVDGNTQMITELARAVALQAPIRPDDPAAASGGHVHPPGTVLPEKPVRRG